MWSTGADPLTQIPVRNAWHLLLYAWDLAEWKGRGAHAQDDAPSLLGLLAGVLADACSDLVRRGLARAHRTRAAVVAGVRGRVDFADSLRGMHFHAGRASCVFPETGVDEPRNRVLRSVLTALSGDPRVEHAVEAKAIALRRRCARTAESMIGVTAQRIDAVDFRRLKTGRNDRDYAMPLAVCELIRSLRAPSEAPGLVATTDLDRARIRFERLFEGFVRNFCRRKLPRHSVKAEQLHWPDEVENPFAPSMRTDATVVALDPPHRRLVIETKFSTTSMATSQYGKATFKSGNLYQLYAYLRTQEDASTAHRSAEGLLLYPTTKSNFEEVMQVQGHRIRVATLDLGAPWSDIEARLLALTAPSAAASPKIVS